MDKLFFFIENGILFDIHIDLLLLLLYCYVVIITEKKKTTKELVQKLHW